MVAVVKESAEEEETEAHCPTVYNTEVCPPLVLYTLREGVAVDRRGRQI